MTWPSSSGTPPRSSTPRTWSSWPRPARRPASPACSCPTTCCTPRRSTRRTRTSPTACPSGTPRRRGSTRSWPSAPWPRSPQRLRFTQNVYVFPLRHPIEVAKVAASAAVLSGGRVSLGLGVGWMAEEHEILGSEFRTRGRRTDEGIDICRKLWAGRTGRPRGPALPVPEAVDLPDAAGRAIPVLVGRRERRRPAPCRPQRRLDRHRLPARRGRGTILDRLEGFLHTEDRHLRRRPDGRR